MFYLISLIAIAIFFLVKDYKKNGEISFGVVLGIILIGVILIPVVKRNLEEKIKEIGISSKSIYELNLKEDLEKIKKEFRIKDEVGLYWFEIKFLANGDITNISCDLIGSNEKKKETYNLRYDKDENDGKYLVKRYKNSAYEEMRQSSKGDINRVFEKIELIKGERPINEYDEYRIWVLGEIRYHHENDRSIFVDKDNNMKELTNEDLPVEGLFIILEGIKKDGFAVNTSAAAHDRLGSIDFIFE